MSNVVKVLAVDQLRKRKSLKWRQFPNDVLPLPVAEMDFESAPAIKAALIDMVERSDTGYLGPFPELFDAFAKFAQPRWGWQVDTKQMRVATDVGVGIVELMRILIKPGEKVMLNSPVYENIWRWITEVNATTVDVPLMMEEDLNYKLDLAAIEKEYQSGVKAHLLCHPHNPVGVIFDRQQLTKLAELAKHYQVVILSDEIHAPLSYNAQRFTPFLAVSDAAGEVGITITGASKSFNLAGLKCAFIITQSSELWERMNKMPLALTWRASLLGAAASTAAYADSVDWLDQVLITLDGNRKQLGNLLQSKLPIVKYRMPDFGYLAWLDVGGLGLGDDPAAVILAKGRVAVNGGVLYGPKHKSFVRLNFGTSPELITEGIDRMVKCL
jgi:cystathionine beta-lyase